MFLTLHFLSSHLPVRDSATTHEMDLKTATWKTSYSAEVKTLLHSAALKLIPVRLPGTKSKHISLKRLLYVESFENPELLHFQSNHPQKHFSHSSFISKSITPNIRYGEEFVHILQTSELWSQLANTYGTEAGEKMNSAPALRWKSSWSRPCQENSTTNSEWTSIPRIMLYYATCMHTV